MTLTNLKSDIMNNISQNLDLKSLTHLHSTNKTLHDQSLLIKIKGYMLSLFYEKYNAVLKIDIKNHKITLPKWYFEMLPTGPLFTELFNKLKQVDSFVVKMIIKLPDQKPFPVYYYRDHAGKDKKINIFEAKEYVTFNERKIYYNVVKKLIDNNKVLQMTFELLDKPMPKPKGGHVPKGMNVANSVFWISDESKKSILKQQREELAALG